MDIDTVTDSISTMKLTEPPKKSHKEIVCLVNKVDFDIENAKQLLRTPEHKKDRSHYYFETTQVRLLKEKLRYLKENQQNNSFDDYSKTKEFLDLIRSATYWLGKLSKESIILKDKLGIAAGRTEMCSLSSIKKRRFRAGNSYVRTDKINLFLGEKQHRQYVQVKFDKASTKQQSFMH